MDLDKPHQAPRTAPEYRRHRRLVAADTAPTADRLPAATYLEKMGANFAGFDTALFQVHQTNQAESALGTSTLVATVYEWSPRAVCFIKTAITATSAAGGPIAISTPAYGRRLLLHVTGLAGNDHAFVDMAGYSGGQGLR